jgi:hypothetical protein
MHRRFAFLLPALLATASGCSSAPPADAVGSSRAAVTSSPYVQLKYAVATDTELSLMGGQEQESLYAVGVIEVANVAYQKSVVVHYQGPSGWVDVNANYLGPSPSNAGNELWSFRTGAYPFLPQYSGEAISFAVEYTVNGITAWDNNGGANYIVGTFGGDGVAEPPVALGEDNLHVSDDQLVSGANGMAFSGHVVLKNLAYDKVVRVVFSTDDWATTQTVAATYAGSVPGGLESWAFSENLPASVTQVQFAVSYAVNGATYWDNNLGANYVVLP